MNVTDTGQTLVRVNPSVFAALPQIHLPLHKGGWQGRYPQQPSSGFFGRLRLPLNDVHIVRGVTSRRAPYRVVSRSFITGATVTVFGTSLPWRISIMLRHASILMSSILLSSAVTSGCAIVE